VSANKTNLERLLELHASLMDSNSYCYFELARTKTTEWMAWICSDQREINPLRKVIAHGQGFSVEEACEQALKDYDERNLYAV
jgi:hypothetical protein